MHIIADGPAPTASLIRGNIDQVSFSTVVSPVPPPRPIRQVARCIIPYKTKGFRIAKPFQNQWNSIVFASFGKFDNVANLIKQMLFASQNPFKTNEMSLLFWIAFRNIREGARTSAGQFHKLVDSRTFVGHIEFQDTIEFKLS